MRRATIQALRHARPAPIRKSIRGHSPSFTFHRLLSQSGSAKNLQRHSGHPRILRSRSASYAAAIGGVTGIVGVWYAINGPGRSLVVSNDSAAPLGQVRAVSTESSKKERRALVLDNEQLYTASIPGDAPIEKSVDGKRMVIEMLSPEQATDLLRKNEESYLVQRGGGVVRYDVVQVQSNSPIEDDHSEIILPHTTPASPNEKSDWMFWGVYDGHSGWATSSKLRQVLIKFVARELSDTFKAASQSQLPTLPTPESIDIAIKKGFVRLDHEIVHTPVEQVFRKGSKVLAAGILQPALSGSCALLSFYDSDSKLLRVACTGDSRAVLGRRTANGQWTAIPLSADQTGGTPSEDARLRREHPDEEFVTHNGRILGSLEPSRAFGDAVYKWSRETSQKLLDSFYARSMKKVCRTPPYVTAEPVVTTTKIDSEKGDFVVMATDGLWDMLSNEEVIGLVGKWLETQANESGASRKSWLSGWFKSADALPVQLPEKANKKGLRARQFTVVDKNAATHLVRNALGGKDSETLCSLLTLPYPMSRRYRDDMTVEVIFFGEGEKTDEVVLNLEASAPKDSPKAKL
ncbi:MAG: hypothetical protein M1814_002914 [Vezdaea aestivalis]|nr:MAG: hypothetical protein M1814_002914 [Vezdaea aestivalis]